MSKSCSFFLLIALVICGSAVSNTDDQELISFTDDAGNQFELTVFAQVVNARQMAQTESGILFVGSMRGFIHAVVPGDKGTTVHEVVRGLSMPSGITLVGEDLYVAAHNQILRFDNIEDNYLEAPPPTVITDDLPSARAHGWKYLSLGPDGFLYFNVGAPCNICLSEDEIFASIVRMDPDTGETEIYAHGVRNSVGMDWNPTTDQMWFSDNGRDWLGDDLPPEEINVVESPGSHFGYPFIHGDDISDPEFGDQKDENTEYVKPAVKIQAHSAAIGVEFYTGKQFPKEYKNALFIAEHGSWNRASRVGYRVSVVQFNEDEPTYKPFADLWLDGEDVSGRPSDVLVANDGSLFISDDHAGKVYKVRYVPSD